MINYCNKCGGKIETTSGICLRCSNENDIDFYDDPPLQDVVKARKTLKCLILRDEELLIYPCQRAMLDQIKESFHPSHNPTNSFYCECDFILDNNYDVWLPYDWEYINKEQEKEEIKKRMSKLIIENCNKHCKYIQ
jgi:hypothetical protein